MIASHEEYPIERMKLDRRKKWLGSVSHDECLKMTDVEDMFEDSDGEENEDDDMNGDDGDSDAESKVKEGKEKEAGFFDDL